MRDHEDSGIAEYIARDIMREALKEGEGWKVMRILEEVCSCVNTTVSVSPLAANISTPR
jgi:hypothetical protein